MINPSLNWQKPKQFDYNLIVIGGGAAGLVSAYVAAAAKAKVALVEQHTMGGDCLNTGCVPSKALINITRLLADCARAKEVGINRITVDFNFAEVMEHVQQVIRTVAPHDSVERYEGLGVEVIRGRARLVAPWQVEVEAGSEKKYLTAVSVIIATGAKPLIPPIPGIENSGYLTSDSIWNLRKLPKRLLVLGGGPIGCELAQCFARLGSRVTLVEMAPRLLMKEDEEVSAMLLHHLQQEDIDVLLQHKAESFKVNKNKKYLCAAFAGQKVNIEFDEVLLALGRKPNVRGFGLEELGVEISPSGTLQTDGFQATNYPHIFACGDVSGPYQFTHTASHQAWYASINALFGMFKKFRTDYSVIPWATFTEPEIARVGFNEQEAKGQSIEYEISRYDLTDLDRAITDNKANGFIKVLTKPGKDKILGVTIVGEHAGDLLAEFVLAMKQGTGLNKILGTIHIYPTLAEANKYVAGVWRKQHQPGLLLNLACRFHQWRRGAKG